MSRPCIIKSDNCHETAMLFQRLEPVHWSSLVAHFRIQWRW